MKPKVAYPMLAVFAAFMVYFQTVQLLWYRIAFGEGVYTPVVYPLIVAWGLAFNIIFGIYTAYLLPQLPRKWYYSYLVIGLSCLLAGFLIAGFVLTIGEIGFFDVVHGVLLFYAGLVAHIKIEQRPPGVKTWRFFIPPAVVYLVFLIIMLP